MVQWSRVAAAAVVGGVGTVVWANRHELPDAGRALLAARGDWLAVGAAALVAWWAAWLLLHLACRRLAGAGGYAEAARLASVTVGAVAVNLLVKSGGLAGLTLFAADARRRGAAAGRVTGAYVLAAVLADVAMSVVVAAGTAVLWADGRLTGGELVAFGAFGAVFAARLVAVVVAVGDRERLHRWWSLPARIWDRIRRRPVRPRRTGAADGFLDAVALVRRRPAAALPALGFALCIDGLGVTMQWAALAAVGGGNRFGPALAAYAVSALFGVVGILPGGLGTAELGAAAVLVAFGVPLGAAAAAAVLFRVWEYWLPVLVGGPLAWSVRRPVSGAAR